MLGLMLGALPNMFKIPVNDYDLLWSQIMSDLMNRREFMEVGAAGAGAMLLGGASPQKLKADAGESGETGREKGTATVRGAFLYPPSEKLRKPGAWWSWPGKDFDAEGRQKKYMNRLKSIEQNLGMRISMDDKPLDTEASVAQFINDVKQSKPDGLLLVPFKGGHFRQIDRILNEVKVPTVIFSSLGVQHGTVKGYFRTGIYMISSVDNLDAVEYGMRMIKTAQWMKEARIISVARSAPKEYEVPHIGTQVRVLPMKRFVDEVKRTEITAAVRELARAYMKNAKKIIEPAEAEIITAARVHFANKRILEAEKGDAIMIDCLRRGLYMPCMSFMSLRDEGIVAGCEGDLDATLTLMLVQQLFDKPGFQGNPGNETEKNHYFHSHCTCASRLLGTSNPSEPYLLRDYAHTNDPTCVPQVLWREGEDVTMAHYLSAGNPHLPGKIPQMLLYSGKVVKSYDMPPVGGCRTNVEITINELENAMDVKAHHNIIFYGNYARELRIFCQLYGIEVVT